MRNTVALIDTNVIIDYLTLRQPFMQEADEILEKCFTGELVGYVAAHSLSNIFYILRKEYSTTRRKEMLSELCVYIDVAGIDKHIIISAIENENFGDLEDGMQAECAMTVGADYIVTRNIAHFAKSAIPAILPGDFLVKLERERSIRPFEP